MELAGQLLLHDATNDEDIPLGELVEEDPCFEAEETKVNDAELVEEVKEEDIGEPEETVEDENEEEEEEEDIDEPKEDNFRLPMIVGLAMFAISAVYVTVRRFLNAHGSCNRRSELNVKRALVNRSGRPSSRRASIHDLKPDNNLTFVIPEDFKVLFDEVWKVREPWQRPLCFVPDTCALVDQLARAGATCVGKAYTEPLPFSIVDCGSEVFRNPEKAGHITGGEYSGCGVLVRSGLADFAVAVDTLGGARITAACCGVIGFKSTFGCVPLGGIALKASALDTVAFMAKEPKYLSRIGDMLDLPGSRHTRGTVIKVFLAKDLFERWMENDGREMLFAVAKATIKWAGQELVEEVDLGQFLAQYATGWEEFLPDGSEENVYDALREVQATIAGYELKCKLLKDCNVAAEELAEEIETYHKALTVRQAIQEAFKRGIRENKIVITPGLMTPPPSLQASGDELRKFEKESLRLCALSTLVGCPQIFFPIHNKNGDTYSVSMMSLNKSDKELLSISERLIPLTKQAMDAELFNLRHERHIQRHGSNHTQLSDREYESEKWREIGNGCYKDGRFEEAVVAYTEAISRCPQKAVYFSNRAMAHLRLGHYIFAEDDCTKAIGLETNNTKALLRRGVARKALGKLIESEEDILEVLRLEPNNRQARIELDELRRFFARD